MIKFFASIALGLFLAPLSAWSAGSCLEAVGLFAGVREYTENDRTLLLKKLLKRERGLLAIAISTDYGQELMRAIPERLSQVEGRRDQQFRQDRGQYTRKLPIQEALDLYISRLSEGEVSRADLMALELSRAALNRFILLPFIEEVHENGRKIFPVSATLKGVQARIVRLSYLQNEVGKANLALLMEIAKRMRPKFPGVSLDNLIEYASVGYAKGLSAFDPIYGFAHSTYLGKAISRQIRKGVRKERRDASMVSLNAPVGSGGEEHGQFLRAPTNQNPRLDTQETVDQQLGKLTEADGALLVAHFRGISDLGIAQMPEIQPSGRVVTRQGVNVRLLSLLSRLREKAAEED